MERNEICTDFLTIIAGTSNTISSAWTEAAADLNDKDKTLKHLKNFMTSIDNVASKKGAVDPKIPASKGVIKNFSGYESIASAFSFLSKHKSAAAASILKDLNTLHSCIEKYGHFYETGYSHNISLLKLEYESAMYLLVTGLTMAISYCYDVTDSNGTVKMVPKTGASFGTTGKMIHQMAGEISGKKHADYLDKLTKAATSTPVSESFEFYTEAVSFAGIVGTINLVSNLIDSVSHVGSFALRTGKEIVRSVFGIVPLIRSCIYLSYKRKADTILALEQNVAFIEQNIDRLEKRTNMDPAQKANIIKKQQAVIEAYKKKAEKLRAELEEGDKDAATVIQKENTTIGKDDEFVLESVEDDEIVNMMDFFLTEAVGSKIDQKIINRRKQEFGKKKSKHKVLEDDFPVPYIKKAVNEFKKQTEMQSISLSIRRITAENSKRYRKMSKIGGQPYWPKDMKYPQHRGKDMCLLAQIDFGKMPHIQDYPTTGMLQFFVPNISEWETANNSQITTVYHQKISNDIDETERPDIEHAGNRSDITPSIRGEFSLEGARIVNTYPSRDTIFTLYREQADQIAYKYGMKYAEFVDVFEEFRHADDAFKRGTIYGTRIGGHPDFIQNEPGPQRKGRYDTLLLQIDSTHHEDIMWSDCGIANIFIDAAKLKSKDFSDVLFHMDCY